ncbi:MAG: iron-containing alcohol dehydrogenase [Gammaproteobacteria bacterium]|nr:iron-containing alcohol dehydrogenase [Gammaproteobacteria bacterium]
MRGFTVSRLPRIVFGNGAVLRLPELIVRHGQRVLLVTGAHSHRRLACWPALHEAFDRCGIRLWHVKIDGEPSPGGIDDVVARARDWEVEVVVGVGGGSALDAAKAVAGLIPVQRSVMEFLEGVGPELSYPGPALPFIAAPTTAGTGSEATKNAVLSVAGLKGFKKSFRDERLVAHTAVVDPELLATCPPHVVAANGMDAVTQLIESYVSVRSTPFTDSLIEAALAGARDALVPLYDEVGDLRSARSAMAYASLISGVALAQTGLGSVHGLAAPLGAFYPIPHGVVCGTLLAAATEVNVDVLRRREPANSSIAKYRRIAEILCAATFPNTDRAVNALIDLLADWTRALNLPRLCEFGVGPDGLDDIVAHCRGSSMQTNPIRLTDDEIKAILVARL